jgi:hypothetical protein
VVDARGTKAQLYNSLPGWLLKASFSSQFTSTSSRFRTQQNFLVYGSADVGQHASAQSISSLPQMIVDPSNRDCA